MLKTAVYLAFILIALQSHVLQADPYQWLEEVKGKKALNWVTEQNQKTDKSLTTDPLYKSLYAEAIDALGKEDKLPSVSVKGNWIYNLWKDTKNPRGLYRRASLESFNSGQPDWQTVLDIDKLSSAENTKWVFRAMNCLAPEHETCVVSLSPGGTDATTYREFNPNLGAFVENGFELPLAKTQFSWLDKDHVLIGTDFGEGSLTTSGYARIQKLWRRGTPLDEAETLIEVPDTSVSAGAVHFSGQDYAITLVVDSTSFWKRKHYQWQEGKQLLLSLPDSARIQGAFNGQLVVSLKDDWSFREQQYTQGSILLIEPAYLRGETGKIDVLAEQSNDFIIEQSRVTSDGILVVAMEDVKSSLHMFTLEKSGWRQQRVKLPTQGAISIAGTSEESFYIRYEDFLTPPTLYAIDSELAAHKVQQQSPTFDSKDMLVEQYFAKSVDGTAVPYFVIMHKDTELNGKNPTNIFAYGGFRNAVQPSYSGSYEDLNGAYGNMWLKRGGVYVVANIRGGGEYGPAWHAAALLENRHKAFEDFESVAEDLIKRKITSSEHLGIEGRSNGGLLVGAAMTRRPDLYGAVVCGVPLLDMKRYHKLLAGASWMAEYGNPDTSDWEFIKEYSPYQNISDKAQYPATFFYTSTKDDRVHPGHARKMAAQLQALGQPVEYYENLEGGHRGSSTTEQLAKRIALAFTHLWRELK